MNARAGMHRFSAHQQALRDEWFALVETKDNWELGAALGEGESLSVMVSNSTVNMRGVAKPGLGRGDDGGHCRAAHEKLAFDLAYCLALPISAVVLWAKDMPVQFKLGRAISSWAFPQAMKWSEANAKGLLSPELKQTATATVSMLRVFHTWIGDADRKPDHLIVDLDSPNDELRIAAIDHGHSMSLYWSGPNASIQVVPNHLQAEGVTEDKDAMDMAIAEIGQLSDNEITRLVQRIPSGYLPEPHRQHILTNLLARKGNLRAAFGL